MKRANENLQEGKKMEDFVDKFWFSIFNLEIMKAQRMIKIFQKVGSYEGCEDD